MRDISTYQKEYYQKNKQRILARVSARRLVKRDEINASNREYLRRNAEKIKLKKQEYYHKNKDTINARNSEWARQNKDPAKRAFYEANRRSRKKRAQPMWANELKIKEFYNEAKRLTGLTKEQWHVDHIVPLQSDKVCGLHCEFNLRVIEKPDNLSKGNRHWPDMWE